MIRSSVWNICLFFETGSHGWPESHCTEQAGLEFVAILLPVSLVLGLTSRNQHTLLTTCHFPWLALVKS